MKRKKVQTCITVGDLMKALSNYGADMLIEVGHEHACEVYHLVPERGECWDDPRGAIAINGCELCNDEP